MMYCLGPAPPAMVMSDGIKGHSKIQADPVFSTRKLTSKAPIRDGY